VIPWVRLDARHHTTILTRNLNLSSNDRSHQHRITVSTSLESIPDTFQFSFLQWHRVIYSVVTCPWMMEFCSLQLYIGEPHPEEVMVRKETFISSLHRFYTTLWLVYYDSLNQLGDSGNIQHLLHSGFLLLKIRCLFET